MLPIQFTLYPSLRRESSLANVGNLVTGVSLGCPVQLLVLLINVVLLQDLGALHLVCLQQLEISFYSMISDYSIPHVRFQLTSQMTAVLQMVHTLALVAFAQLITDQSSHHSSNPLFSNDRVLGGLESLGVGVVNAVESGSDGGLLSLELGGFGGRHCDTIN